MIMIEKLWITLKKLFLRLVSGQIKERNHINIFRGTGSQ